MKEGLPTFPGVLAVVERTMHEFGVAQSIVNKVLEVARANEASRVLQVNLEIGEVSLVNAEQLTWHINMIAADTIAAGMAVNVLETPLKIRCAACGYEGGVRYEEKNPQWHTRIPVFECVKCESADTAIVEGRELRIKDISVDYD
ncbi:hydrogenase maturation nickel metallochaperone HypA [Thermodesulfobacteriota bacterium]